jgi:hypothetical protein
MKNISNIIALGTLTLTTSLWMFWGTSEMYYEGWGLPFPQPLAYLTPALICLLLTALCLRWPHIGGWLLIGVGGAFTFWWWGLTYRRGGLSLISALEMVPVSTLLILTGWLILHSAKSKQPPFRWRWYVSIGVPLLIFFGVSAVQLPQIMRRLDDGYRGERLIQGNGVTLIWAPAGPGWNWKQPWGGYPSWGSLARYGKPPIGLKTGDKLGAAPYSEQEMASTGLCAYLSADGLRLMDEAQNIWRMPTTDEVIRSLTRGGVNAGCTPPEGTGRATCESTPDKETPLWAPDQPPIYYWSGEEANSETAFYVSYNGYVNTQPKDWGNPRHGYRCVREP